MKMKAAQLLDAYITLTAIINEKRRLPQKGAYRIARMHSKLSSEAMLVDGQRNELIRKHGSEIFGGPDGLQLTGYKVKESAEEEYRKEWMTIAEEDIELDVEPIPLEQLGTEGTILPNEFHHLGPLVAENG